MPKKRRVTYGLMIKKNKRFKPLPRLTFKEKRDVMLGKKKVPPLYAVMKVGKRVIKSKRL